MPKPKLYLLLLILLTLLFIALVAAASHLAAIGNKGGAMALFILAFVSAAAQIASLALYLRHRPPPRL